MNFKNSIIIMMFLVGIFFSSCEKIEATSLVYDKSNFTEVQLFIREIVKDHTSREDVTVSSTVDDAAHSVTVIVKAKADLTKLYGIAKLAKGCTVEPVDGATLFGKVGNFSSPQKYLIKSRDGEPVEWTLTVKK